MKTVEGYKHSCVACITSDGLLTVIDRSITQFEDVTGFIFFCTLSEELNDNTAEMWVSLSFDTHNQFLKLFNISEHILEKLFDIYWGFVVYKMQFKLCGYKMQFKLCGYRM